MNNSEKESQRDRIVEIIDKISNEEHLELVKRFAGKFLDEKRRVLTLTEQRKVVRHEL